MLYTREDVTNSKLRQMDARIHSILVTEARAFASTAVLSMQAAALFWGRSTTGQSGDWWQSLIMTVIMLGIVAWESFSGRVKDRSRLIKMVLIGFAVIWVAFGLTAIPLTYKVFVVLALVLLVDSLLCVIFLFLRTIPKRMEPLAKSLEDGSSIMLSCALIGSTILAYGRFMDNNIHGWYVNMLWLGVLIALMLLFAPKVAPSVSTNSRS